MLRRVMRCARPFVLEFPAIYPLYPPALRGLVIVLASSGYYISLVKNSLSRRQQDISLRPGIV